VVCTALGIAAAAITDRHPDWMNADAIKLINSFGGWILPLTLFSSLLIVRLFFWAPYLIYKEALRKIVEIEGALPGTVPVARAVIDVSPEYLMSLYADHTSMQAQKLIEPYIGKWIKVSGPLDDVTDYKDLSRVTIGLPHPTIPSFSFASIEMSFRQSDHAIVFPFLRAEPN
jgi:hypothetical protein